MTRILIVEDNADNLQLLEVILLANDYEILSATDGEAGVKTAISEQPDLVLMDIHMPGMNGYEALSQLRANEATKNTPVIAVTGNATIADREQMVAARFDRIVMKPFGIDEMLAAIAEVLQN